MDLTFVYLPGFVKEWDRLRLTDLDLQALESDIHGSRESAPVMRGTGGLRKIRFAPPSRPGGKSGATRVGFAWFRSRSAVIVVAIFAKSDAANFTAAERAEIGKWLKELERTFK